MPYLKQLDSDRVGWQFTLGDVSSLPKKLTDAYFELRAVQCLRPNFNLGSKKIAEFIMLLHTGDELLAGVTITNSQWTDYPKDTGYYALSFKDLVASQSNGDGEAEMYQRTVLSVGSRLITETRALQAIGYQWLERKALQAIGHRWAEGALFVHEKITSHEVWADVNSDFLRRKDWSRITDKLLNPHRLVMNIDGEDENKGVLHREASLVTSSTLQIFDTWYPYQKHLPQSHPKTPMTITTVRQVFSIAV